MTMLLETDALAAAQALAPELSDRAQEGELLGTMPADLVEKARDAGLFGLMTPRSLGGLELAPREVIDVFEALCRADGSAGWTIIIGNATAFFTWFEPEIAAALLAGRRETIGAGCFAPTGKLIDRGDGAFDFTGRWSFASGCCHADGFFLGGFVMDGDQPRMIEGFGPDWRFAYVPAEAVEIIDNWDVAGLRGTGSNDVSVAGAVVNERHTIAPFRVRARHENALARFPLFTLVGVQFAAVPLGIGRRALDELLALAPTKARVGSMTPIGGDADMQVSIAQADAALRAARGYVCETVDDAYATARAGAPPTIEQRARVQVAVQNAMRAGLAAVDLAFSAGGASALRNDNVLQRCFRDLHAAAQHAYFSPASWKRYTKVLLGTEREQLFML
jgi:alkylation response protein AidB-like acyl-CoA dehydrogenase